MARALAIVLGLALGLAGAAEPAVAVSPLKITSFTSVFVPKDLATAYTVEATHSPGTKLTYTWYLGLGLVDPRGSSAPGIPDSHAAFDPDCNNAKLAGGEDVGFETHRWQNQGAEFTWYHGDKGAYPGSSYGCVHQKMGPSGHQGGVSVVVSDGTWACVASSEGSNLSPQPEPGRFGACFKGAAAEGTIVHDNGRLVLTVKNTGKHPIRFLRFDSPANVRIRDIEGPRGTEVIPHGEGFSWQSGDGLQPGQSIEFSFVTDDPFPPGEGNLLVSDSGDTFFNGTLNGPTPHAPPPTTTTDQKQCHCADVSLQLDPTLLNKRLRPDQHDFGVGITWRLTCTAGRGSCLAFLKFSPPEILAGSLPKPKNNLLLNLTNTVLTCHAPCGKSNAGRFQIPLRTRGQLNELFGRTLAFTVVLECSHKSARARVNVFVDNKGILRPKP